MSLNSPIEWTDATWNPTTGCRKVSPGCDHCYAATLARRLKRMGSARYQNDGPDGEGFGLTLHPDKLEEPLSWRKPRRVFVNSMSDLFIAGVPAAFLDRAFEVMTMCPQHQFQILTKRPTRMAREVARIVDRLGFIPSNVWLGTSVENQEWAEKRIPPLIETPAAVRFLSCEPLLGPIDLSRWLRLRRSRSGTDLHWVIVGGESGLGFRPVDVGWVRDLRDQCVAARVPFFFKQHGGRTPKAGGRELDGRTWDEMPAPPQLGITEACEVVAS
jgi:protein gp37